MFKSSIVIGVLDGIIHWLETTGIYYLELIFLFDSYFVLKLYNALYALSLINVLSYNPSSSKNIGDYVNFLSLTMSYDFKGDGCYISDNSDLELYMLSLLSVFSLVRILSKDSELIKSDWFCLDWYGDWEDALVYIL
jgi:hypothetical protein